VWKWVEDDMKNSYPLGMEIRMEIDFYFKDVDEIVKHALVPSCCHPYETHKKFVFEVQPQDCCCIHTSVRGILM